MDAAAVRVAQKEDGEEGIDQQDIFDRVVLFLAAITVRLFSRVLAADDPPFRPVMGKRGDTGRGGDQGRWRLHQRCDGGGRVGLRDTEALGQGPQGAGGSIAEGAQGRQQRGKRT